MFSAIRAAAPRITWRSPSIGGAGAASTGRAAAAASRGGASASPNRSRKYRRHSSSTAVGLAR